MIAISKITREEVCQLVQNSINNEYNLLKKDLEQLKLALKVDKSDVVDFEDLSHNSESAQRYAHTLQRVHEFERELNMLKELKPGSLEFVHEGSVVDLGDKIVVVGVLCKSIYVEGLEIIGAHSSAPFVKAMIGKKVGEVFRFANQPFTVVDIL